MKLTQYQIDAFASRPLAGNPAAVCPLDNWLEDSLMQAIAEENNLSETAFFVRSQIGYRLRWFTPLCEVDLCGHATLAAAFVIFRFLGHADPTIIFETRGGELTVSRDGESLRMDFPARPPALCEVPEALIMGLGQHPIEVVAADDYIALFEHENMVRDIAPDLNQLAQLDRRGVVITAPGIACDFVSRVFAPKFGIPEDPVTGSTHCELAPYWAHKLNKTVLHARQISRRGGEISCEIRADRVFLSGAAALFMVGEISLP